MKIAFINGSPKVGKSNSGWLLEQLEKYLGEGHDLVRYKVGMKPLNESDYENLSQVDVLVFSFPNFPRFAWRFMATRAFWHPHAKKNGLKIHELKRQVL